MYKHFETFVPKGKMPKTLKYRHKEKTFLGPVCYVSSNSHFHILNNITHFFTLTYFKKLQKSHFKLLYQTPSQNGPNSI